MAGSEEDFYDRDVTSKHQILQTQKYRQIGQDIVVKKVVVVPDEESERMMRLAQLHRQKELEMQAEQARRQQLIQEVRIVCGESFHVVLS
jgi:hypothetical protein